jgi:poly-beta-1,6-N-acetyl-D-glucosamine synthase
MHIGFKCRAFIDFQTNSLLSSPISSFDVFLLFNSASSTFCLFHLPISYGKRMDEKNAANALTGIQVIPKYSIIIPYRNESNHLENCLRNLLNQKTAYPFEIIAVDDNSDDGGRNIVEKLAKLHPQIQSTQLTQNAGKKAAIQQGIEKSTGEIIITVDADVRVGVEWLNAIGDFNTAHAPDMIIMPVMLESETTMFEQMQVVEFIGLMGMTGGSAKQNHALMCNGANLAFLKSKYLEVQGFVGNEKIASGDDMFLMIKLKQANASSIMFLQDPRAIAWTKPFSSILDFLNQRIRWASKAPHLKDNHIVFIGSLIMIVNVLLVIQFIFLLSGTVTFFAWLICFAIKTFADFNLYRVTRSFFDKGDDRLAFAITELFLPFYTVFIPLAGIFYKPSWKGRRGSSSSATKTQRYAKS